MAYGDDYRYGAIVEIGCARVSTTEQDLERQVHPLEQVGRTVRDTLNLIHELSARGVGVKNLADPLKVDSSNPSDPMAQLSVVLLALFAQTGRTCTVERAAHARSVATAKDRWVRASACCCSVAVGVQVVLGSPW